MHVVAVHLDPRHRFSKLTALAVQLVEGIGVEGDAHAGATVKHRSRARWHPHDPNLRQVHLIHAELLDHLADLGYDVAPGQLGENVTTRGVDLLGLSAGSRLRLGETAAVTLTGLRNPCVQIDRFRPGLMAQLARRLPDGEIERLAGVMAVVSASGPVASGDPVVAEPPAGPHVPLGPV